MFDLLNILFPHRCVGCGESLPGGGAALCEGCWQEADISLRWSCAACGGRLPAVAALHRPPRQCHPHAYTLGYLSFYDSPAVRRLVHAAKFQRRFSVLRQLSDAAARELAPYAGAFDAIVATPLSSPRLRWRGRNQSAMFAEQLAAALRRPYLPEVLHRRHAPPQSTQRSRRARQTNVAGTFSAPGASLIAHKRLLLVDDVWTTGATMAEAVAALRGAGARSVTGFVIARSR